MQTATAAIETILAGPHQEKRFNEAMARMAAVDGLVATGSMTKDGWAIYRPQRLAADLGPGARAGDIIGRYIGQTPGDCEVANMTLAQAVQTFMLSNRCEWCGWPERTGFRSESDQRTPKCHHAAVTVNCLRCGGASNFTPRETPFCRSCGDAERLAACLCEAGLSGPSPETGLYVQCEQITRAFAALREG